ncbi:MAG: hypothetical protein L0H25_04630, partial [Micrococcales bacterium]|nr:hypothetical protein [Micrococcales bacterium]
MSTRVSTPARPSVSRLARVLDRARVPAARPSWVVPILLANLVGEILIVVTGPVVISMPLVSWTSGWPG